MPSPTLTALSCWAAALGDGEFPLLIKMLFPKEKLSVQVHPDDAMAREYGEPRGKTECWYALDARTRSDTWRWESATA